MVARAGAQAAEAGDAGGLSGDAGGVPLFASGQKSAYKFRQGLVSTGIRQAMLFGHKMLNRNGMALLTKLRRSAAAMPAAGAVLGVAMGAGSATAPDAVPGAEVTSGALSEMAKAMTSEAGTTGAEALKLNAALPANGVLRPARPFVFVGSPEDRRRALRCLTQAVYYEAALEPEAGQQGVAQVVLNRVRDPNYADTVCGVVFEGAERSTGCQFSFTCDGAMSQPPVAWAWERAGKVAERALSGFVAQQVGTATHYHADYVYPWWAPSVAKVAQVGAHIFYRWKGIYGETAAFRSVYKGREPSIDEARFSRPRVLDAGTDGQVEVAGTSAAADGMRTVEIDGQQRVVGVASLGGRRMPTQDEVRAINERLAIYENRVSRPVVVAPEPSPAAPGVTRMDVEEVGRPGS